MGDKAAKPQNYSGKFAAAKAGRRKIYTTGKRKTKDFTPSKGYMIPTRKEQEIQTYPPKGNRLKEQLEKLRKLSHNQSNGSDPFMFQRMEAHIRAGILEL